MNDKKLTILIVNYNTWEYSKNLISDLLNQNNSDFRICLVDQNSSEDETCDLIKYAVTNGVYVIQNTINEDLNRVWNLFYDMFDSEYLCFLNSDVRVTNNFVRDTIELLDTLDEVGIAIHTTNNINYMKADPSLTFEILKPKLFQGWDFTIKRSLYKRIPEELRIFGGDDFLFGWVDKMGYEIGLIYSSPILHYKEVTRNKNKTYVNIIHRNDTQEFKKIIKKLNIKSLMATCTTDKCGITPPKNFKLINL